MADLNGTSGNDLLQPFGDNLLLVLSANSLGGVWPLVNVLVNGTVVLSNVSITADNALNQTQLLSVPLAAGTTVSSVTLQYLNDEITPSGDRNLYLSSISLNGHALPPSAAAYVRTADGQVFDTIAGQGDLFWGGELRFTGPVVTGATAHAGGTLSVEGLDGIDTIMLGGSHSDYSISQTASGYAVSRLAGGQTLNLSNIERLDFQSGNSVALDLGGHAGIAAEVIGAMFGQSFMNNSAFVGIAIGLLDHGMAPTQLVALAISTPLFQQLAGSSSNAAFVNLVYQNVMGHAPSAAELDSYVSLLNSGAVTQASLGFIAAVTPANQAHLVGVIQSGIEFA